MNIIICAPGKKQLVKMYIRSVVVVSFLDIGKHNFCISAPLNCDCTFRVINSHTSVATPIIVVL